MKKLFLFGILLIVMLSVAVVGVRALTAEKGTCVIGPNQGSNAERLGQGVETQAGSVCDASAEGCEACLDQCAPYKKIKDLYGCIVEVVPDQVNDVEQPSISMHCGGEPMSLFQSFTPSASPLAAVDLRLRVGGEFPVTGYDTTINIRSGTPDGDVLGTATTFVPDPQVTGIQLMVNFELLPIELTPGNTYVIEWISPAGVILGWMADDDTYTGGTAFGCTGIPLDVDFIFITYTAI